MGSLLPETAGGTNLQGSLRQFALRQETQNQSRKNPTTLQVSVPVSRFLLRNNHLYEKTKHVLPHFCVVLAAPCTKRGCLVHERSKSEVPCTKRAGLVHERPKSEVPCTKRWCLVHERAKSEVSCTKRGGLVHEGAKSEVPCTKMVCLVHGGPRTTASCTKRAFHSRVFRNAGRNSEKNQNGKRNQNRKNRPPERISFFLFN